MNTKYSLPFLFPLFILVISICGCQKSPINGDLDGQWQVMSVEPASEEEIITNRMYYCISLHVCQLSISDEGVWASGNMIYEEDMLSIDFPDLDTDLDMKKLNQFGINSNPVTFNIEYLDKKKLILKDGKTTVTLRKF